MDRMLKSYKYRIYPNKEQVEIIEKTFGICRLVYNLALETKIRAWQSAKINLSAYDLMSQLTIMKREYPWMREVDSQSLYASIKNLDTAYKSFFRGNGFPKFKKKGKGQSFQARARELRVDFNNRYIKIPKITRIKSVISKEFSGTIKTITISRVTSGKYFASILVDGDNYPMIKKNVKVETTLGIDVGIKSFVVTSEGQFFEPNRFLKNSLQRLKCLQRRASRKKKGGSNWKKGNKSIAIIHESIANKRSDYCHKITTSLIRDSQADTFVIESLNIKGMLGNRSLSQAISDVSFGEFFRQMAYKCEWYGKNLIKIGRFEPSSKTCSHCGHIKQDLTLADRKWTCMGCNTIHDRDLNAAKNIKAFGLEQYSRPAGPVEPVESRRLRRAMKQEFSVIKGQTATNP